MVDLYDKSHVWLICMIRVMYGCMIKCHGLCETFHLKYYTLFLQSIRTILCLYFFQSNASEILFSRVKID